MGKQRVKVCMEHFEIDVSNTKPAYCIICLFQSVPLQAWTPKQLASEPALQVQF